MNLQTSLTVHLSALLEDAAIGGLGTPAHAIRLAKTLTWANGVNADQADIAYAAQFTIAASGTQVIDLNSLTDTLGNALTFAKVKALAFFAADGNGDVVDVGPNTTEGFGDWLDGTTPEIKLGAGDLGLITRKSAGWTIVNNTNDKLLITNNDSGATATIDVVIVGTDT